MLGIEPLEIHFTFELNKQMSSSSKTLTQVSAKPTDSHFWRGLMHIKEEVLAKGCFLIKDGTNTRFWDDTWVGDKPLKHRYKCCPLNTRF